MNPVAGSVLAREHSLHRGQCLWRRDPLSEDGLFYASVNIENDKIILAGSRAVAIVAVDDSISGAEAIAEKEISCIEGPLFHRKDIGKSILIQSRIDHMRSIR